MRNSVLLILIALSSAASAQALPAKSVPLVNAHGEKAGKIILTEGPTGVLLHFEASGLTPGRHALHFHEKADCSAPMFKSAGSHVHMTMPSVHGLLNPAGPDSGDLPNVFADARGNVAAEIFAPSVTLRAGTARANLLDADGSALIVHANPDDYSSQPIGGAGDRVLCAAIH